LKIFNKWNQTGVIGYVLLVQPASVSTSTNRNTPGHRECAHGDAFIHDLIAGAGQQSTRGTIAEIVRAVAAGAQAVLVITPNFYKSAITQPALIDHYTAMPTPQSAGHSLQLPDLTGIRIEPTQLRI